MTAGAGAATACWGGAAAAAPVAWGRPGHAVAVARPAQLAPVGRRAVGRAPAGTRPGPVRAGRAAEMTGEARGVRGGRSSSSSWRDAMDCAVRAIVFDLDGVMLVRAAMPLRFAFLSREKGAFFNDSRPLHFEALNAALASVDPRYVISREEHNAKYEARPTKVKLATLTADKGLPQDMHESIWRLKQEKTAEMISSAFAPCAAQAAMLAGLRARGLRLFCASNAIRGTIETSLVTIGVRQFFEAVYSSTEDAGKRPKPDPAVYKRCIADAGLLPRQVLIVEDSVIGRQAALLSGAHVLGVGGPEDVTGPVLRAALARAAARNEREQAAAATEMTQEAEAAEVASVEAAAQAAWRNELMLMDTFIDSLGEHA